MITYCLWSAWKEGISNSYDPEDILIDILVIPLYVLLTFVSLIIDILTFPLQIIAYLIYKKKGVKDD